MRENIRFAKFDKYQLDIIRMSREVFFVSATDIVSHSWGPAIYLPSSEVLSP